jgi:hypothetical protein
VVVVVVFVTFVAVDGDDERTGTGSYTTQPAEPTISAGASTTATISLRTLRIAVTSGRRTRAAIHQNCAGLHFLP